MTTHKMYLGDSVYVDVDYDGVVLTTENDSFGPSNTIYLEASVMHSLVDYWQRLLANAQRQKELQDGET